MTREELIGRLREIDVIVREPVMLRSGKTSEFYCDIKKAYGYPDILDALAGEIGPHITRDITAITGSGYGGVPLAAVLSLRHGKHFVLTRDKAKAHGRKNPFDGYIPQAHDTVLVVDDVLTTGSSVNETLEALAKTDAKVKGAVVLVKRGDPELPIPYVHILDIDELL